MTDQTTTNDEDFGPAQAGRPPTPDEERAAERSAKDVDLDSVAKNYQHANELGAHVKGEGQIEPDRIEPLIEDED
jgi:hypothetical protein